jgi:hypothetical protein
MGRKLNGWRSSTGCACGAGQGTGQAVYEKCRFRITGCAASRRLKGTGSGDRRGRPGRHVVTVPPMLRGQQT